jgi:hypothetical protein
MDKVKKIKGTGWGKVPHGIIDAAIPDTLKLLLWYGYDKPDDWTFSVAEVSRSLGKTKQCIRSWFRKFVDAGVFTQAEIKENKHGTFPVYSFHREPVDAFIKSQLKFDPETNPETDVETDPETNPDLEKTPTNTDIPRLITKNDCTENKSTKEKSASSFPSMPSDTSQSAAGGVHIPLDKTTGESVCGNPDGSQPALRVAPVVDIGLELAERFERLFRSNTLQCSPEESSKKTG